MSSRLVNPAVVAPENVFQCQEDFPCVSIQLAVPFDVSVEDTATAPENGTTDIFTLPAKLPLNMVLMKFVAAVRKEAIFEVPFTDSFIEPELSRTRAIS